MKRIAILGCENSHADTFLTLLQEEEDFRDVTVVGVFSEEKEAADKLHEKFGVPVFADYADGVGKVDGLVITARHGDNHYRYAKPYLDSHIPMFIDKPITVTEEDAVDFLHALQAADVRICGGSSLKQDACVGALRAAAQTEKDGKTVGGFVRAPYDSENPYGGFFFYSQHLVEMVCEIFGRYPLSVTAKQNGMQIGLTFHYADYDVAGLYCDKSGAYYAARMAEHAGEGYNIVFTRDWYYREISEFYKLLSGGEQTVPYGDIFAPVFIMNAIYRSLTEGGEVAVVYKE